jgi:hypothetical protein
MQMHNLQINKEDFMNFIFPKNYNFKPKILGFIDYTTAILDSIIALFLYFISNLIFTSLSSKIYFFIALFFPILLFSILNFQKENIITVIGYMYSFFNNSGIYLYRKKYHDFSKENQNKENFIHNLLKNLFN